jgi:hypothetical protein
MGCPGNIERIVASGKNPIRIATRCVFPLGIGRQSVPFTIQKIGDGFTPALATFIAFGKPFGLTAGVGELHGFAEAYLFHGAIRAAEVFGWVFFHYRLKFALSDLRPVHKEAPSQGDLVSRPFLVGFTIGFLSGGTAYCKGARFQEDKVRF